VGIKLEEQALLLTLDQALVAARSKEPLPEIWLTRAERIGEYGVKTYVAALGGALLAKATNPEVDSLTQDIDAGRGGYSLRKATEFLALHNDGRFHLGAQGRWPLNNRPFLGGPARIDDFSKISTRARPAFEDFRDMLRELNGLSKEEAQLALAAFLRVRMAVQESERRAAQTSRRLESGLVLSDLIGVIDRFVRTDPEGGRRAQALTAAVLDCAFDEVELLAINNPHPGDVRVLSRGRIVLVAEVKQVAVTAAVPAELARQTVELGADLALLVVIAEGQAPLDRDRIQRDAIRGDGTVLMVCESVLELITAVAVSSATPALRFEDGLPGAFAARLREIEVGQKAQEEWRQLVEARSATLFG
jgi:hypothetical protein